MKPGSFRDVLGHLLRKKDAGAEAFALQLATAPFPSDADARQRVFYSIAELLAHHPHHWKTIWPIFQANPPLGLEVLGLVASEHEFSSFATKLSEDEIADICLWISKLGYDKETDQRDQDKGDLVAGTVALPHWWNSLINFLTYKGTVRACDSIRKLMAALPQYEGLKWSLREAQERMRRATWIPPHPDEVLALVSAADMRLVRNGRELLDVMAESLDRLQSDLQGIQPSAEDLWSELPKSQGAPRLFRPKDENFLSNYIKRHLDRDLRQRGLILNREVQIRAPMGGKKGEDTDIFIDVLIPAAQPIESERLSAVIEVKGCWNPDLDHAMGTQLAERYMTDSGIHYGMYLVGWFMCPQWDTKDPRRNQTPSLTLEKSRTQFEQQASELSNDQRPITSFVINAALR